VSAATTTSYVALAAIDLAIFTVAFRWFGLWDRYIAPRNKDGHRLNRRNLVVAVSAYAFGLLPIVQAAWQAARGR
jgi:hypothetical protein